MRKAALAGCLLLFAVSSVWGQVTVRKQAREGGENPGLWIAEVRAPAVVRDVLVSTLRRCDWFRIVNSRSEARYLLRAEHVAGSPEAFEVQVTRGDGTPVVSFRQRTRSDEKNWLAYKTVDTLIERIFDNPGLCATKIAFAAGKGAYKEILSCNFDGTGTDQLTRNRTISTEPSWGPGAATMVYTVYGTNYTDVVLMDITAGRQRRLSSFPGLNAGADLSPNGRWTALVELYLLRTRDGSVRRLTNDTAVESSPCWSPDGSALCFVSDRAGRPRLYIQSVGGGTARPLLSSTAETVSPDWSPVSDRICFSTRRGNQYVVGVVDMNDSSREVKILTRAAGDWEAPSWAPDGRHLVCSRTQNGRRELYMVDSWHGRMLPITKPGNFYLPNWSDRF